MAYDPIENHKRIMNFYEAPFRKIEERFEAVRNSLASGSTATGKVEQDETTGPKLAPDTRHIELLAATLAAGLLATGKSAFGASPEGAVKCFDALLTELTEADKGSAREHGT